MEQTLGSLEAYPHFWDWVTLACLLLSVLGFLIFLVWLLGLPGRIAVARKHPDAEAVYAMGWVGFLAIVPWIQALIWAFKPTDKVDIRYLPEQERRAEQEELERLSRYAYGRELPAKNVEELRERTATSDSAEKEMTTGSPDDTGSSDEAGSESEATPDPAHRET
jgi:hypothetical protein